jgi:4-hydroxy-tetrahydrodipicolinate synthase
MHDHPFRIENGGIWAAIHTPFRADGSLDVEGLRHNAGLYVDALRLTGVFYCGLMGEYWSLTVAERRVVTETLAHATGGRLGLAPNCTHHSPAETLELVNHAQAQGCHYVALMNPPVGPRSDQALFEYFRHVCAATRMQVILFNTPAGGYLLNPALLVRLCELPNAAGERAVRAIKAAGGPADRAAVRAACGGTVVVSDPMEQNWRQNLIEHRQTLLFADPEPYLYQQAGRRPIADYYALYQKGDLDAFEDAFRKLEPLRRIYNRWVMDPLMAGQPPNAPLKAWASIMGLAAGPTRIPVPALPAADLAVLRSQLREAGWAA